MKKYDIQQIKLLFGESKYKELIQIVNDIRHIGEYSKEDIEILNYLFKNKDVDTCLYETMIITYEEFRNKFMQEDVNKSEDYIETYEEKGIDTFISLADLKKILIDKDITLTEYKLSNEERPKISLKVESDILPYIYSIMGTIYKEKITDIGFEIISLKSIDYDIFTVFLLPTKMSDEIIEKQINQMNQIIVKSILNTKDSISYQYNIPKEINDFVDYFKKSKTRYFYENFKVGYIRNNNNDKFYLSTNTKEEIINFEETKNIKYNNPKIVSFDNKPYVSDSKAAYVNTKTIGFVIFLTILVIIAVSVLTLKG